MTATRPSRLHHYAFPTKDQEATRAFYEDVIGLPLVATWSEAEKLGGSDSRSEYCHTFFELADGGAIAFFQFADPADQTRFDPDYIPTQFRHLALNVTREVQDAIERRLAAKGETPRVVDHGYCRSLYTRDPNGLFLEFTVDADNVDEIARERSADAHETLKRWLAGDHTTNNTYR
ncbi:MAG TPA: VOC family protein [Acidimicrobiales bacterium]|nr:VOC family protein [Acidimicrobiales bacterium]